jgi:hypothetical protein
MKTLATIKHGKVKVKSKKQLRFLFGKKLPFTLMHKTKSGKIVGKRINTK